MALRIIAAVCDSFGSLAISELYLCSILLDIPKVACYIGCKRETFLGGIADRDRDGRRNIGARSRIVATAAKEVNLDARTSRCLETIYRHPRRGSRVVSRPRRRSDGLSRAEWLREIDHDENDHGPV